MSLGFGQILLLVLVGALAAYVFLLRSMLTDRLAMLLLALVGIVLVAWPGLSSDLAKFLGIGRGTDLIFYLFMVFCLFRFVSAAAATRRLERHLTLLVRDMALMTARPRSLSRTSDMARPPADQSTDGADVL